MTKKLKIYVADAEPDVTRLLRGTLTPMGHTVQEAFDLDRVLDEVRVFKPDLIFLTTDVPGGDYAGVVRAIRDNEDCSACPLVAMVERDHQDPDEVRDCPGVTDVMRKPLMANDLVARIKVLSGEALNETTDVNLSDEFSFSESSRRVPINDLATGSQRYDRDLTTIIEITEAICSSLEPDDTFYVLVKRAADAITCDRCNVVLTGVGETEAFVLASHDDPNLKRHPIDLSLYPEYCLAIDSLEPVLIDDAQLHPVTEKVRDEVSMVQLGSTLVFPLIVREAAVGVMSLSTRGTSRDFEPAEVLLLRSLANLAACVVKATTALESIRYMSVAQKAPAEEFENIVLDLDDQIEMLIDEFEGQ
jgi:CheY-like chemotaxis protein